MAPQDLGGRNPQRDDSVQTIRKRPFRYPRSHHVLPFEAHFSLLQTACAGQREQGLQQLRNERLLAVQKAPEAFFHALPELGVPLQIPGYGGVMRSPFDWIERDKFTLGAFDPEGLQGLHSAEHAATRVYDLPDRHSEERPLSVHVYLQKCATYVGDCGLGGKGVAGWLHGCSRDPGVFAVEDVFGFGVDLLVCDEQGQWE